jgi:hypothetical protein
MNKDATTPASVRRSKRQPDASPGGPAPVDADKSRAKRRDAAVTQSNLLRVMHGHRQLCFGCPEHLKRRAVVARKLRAGLRQIESDLGASPLLSLVFRYLRRDITAREKAISPPRGLNLPELWNQYETIRAYLLQQRHTPARRDEN